MTTTRLLSPNRSRDRGSTRTMSEALMPLVLRRAQGHRPGEWGPHDFDVLNDGREVGRIYRIRAATEIWWWGVSFMLTSRKSHGDAPTREQAMAEFKAEYERWLKEQPKA